MDASLSGVFGDEFLGDSGISDMQSDSSFCVCRYSTEWASVKGDKQIEKIQSLMEV